MDAVTAPTPGMVSRRLARGRPAVGGNQQVFQAFLPGAVVADLPDVVAHQLLDGRAGQGSDGGLGVFEQGADLGVGQIRDIGEVCWGCLGEALGGGEAVDEFEDPSGGEVFGA